MRFLKSFYFFFILFLFAGVVSCKKEIQTPNIETDGYVQGEELTAGENLTCFDESENAFNNPIDGLTEDEQIKFVVGNSFNRNNWVTAPSSTTSRDGLGPVFNAFSCSGCHILDGRGQPPINGQKSQGFVMRISQSGFNMHGGPNPVSNYGDQINNRSIENVDDEGDVNISYQEITGKFSDGTVYSLRKPTYNFTNPDLSGVEFSPRVAPKMAGAAIFDAIEDAQLLVLQDPNDVNQDGISGKVNMCWDYYKQKLVVGRIGWKSNIPNVKNQVGHAFLNDIGITSNAFPKENLYGKQISQYGNLVNGGNPEIDDTLLGKVYFYTSTLAMPARRNAEDKNVLAGKKLFYSLGCKSCHLPEIKTGNHPEIPYLSYQTIRPFTDLLLHDMGNDLADNRPDFQATGREWRTAPLWGLGMVKTVNGHTTLLHDGRARNPEEAILWHGGEASSAKSLFIQLAKGDRDNLIKFLNSL